MSVQHKWAATYGNELSGKAWLSVNMLLKHSTIILLYRYLEESRSFWWMIRLLATQRDWSTNTAITERASVIGWGNGKVWLAVAVFFFSFFISSPSMAELTWSANWNIHYLNNIGSRGANMSFSPRLEWGRGMQFNTNAARNNNSDRLRALCRITTQI